MCFLLSVHMRAQPVAHTFVFPIPLCSRRASACMTSPHLDEKGHLDYPGISRLSSVFRYRRKLRVTDRHQPGILRRFSQPLFCAVRTVQSPPVPRSLTVHYYDGNYGVIIRINRETFRNKPQSFLGRHKGIGTIRRENRATARIFAF